MLTRLEKYCKWCSTMRSHNRFGGRQRVHREESDTEVGMHRKIIDQVKVGGTCAKALWSKGAGHVRRTKRSLQKSETECGTRCLHCGWSHWQWPRNVSPVGHVKEVNSILGTVGSCCSALIGVDLNLENVHLDLHFRKISLTAVLVWTRRGRLNLEWWLSVGLFFFFRFSSELWSPGLI